MPKVSKPTIKMIPLEKIDEPAGRIRLDIDPEEIKSLAENIEAVGLLQHILVRPKGERFEIVAGHRRVLAFHKLGRKKIACVVQARSDVECALARASENLGRVDLSLVEEAAVYADLRDRCGLTVDEIGKYMSKSPGVVMRRLDLLKMPPQLQKAVHFKQIAYSVAEEFWSLGDEGAIDYYLSLAIEHGVTQKVARDWVKEFKDKKRRQEPGTVDGGGVASPLEPRPIYMPCDLCTGPFVLGEESRLCVCSNCIQLIKNALAGPKAS